MRSSARWALTGVPHQKYGAVHQRIKLIHRLTIEEAGRQGRNRLIPVVYLRRLFWVQRQHGKVALSVTPVAGRVEDIGAVGPQRAVIGPQITVEQRRLRLVGGRRCCTCSTMASILPNSSPFRRQALAASQCAARQKRRPATLPALGCGVVERSLSKSGQTAAGRSTDGGALAAGQE